MRRQPACSVLRLDGAAAEKFGEVVEVALFAEQVVGWWARKLSAQL
jgi:hypothetical protein